MFGMFAIFLLLTLRFLLFSCTNETHSDCVEVIKDKEFMLQFPTNKSANDTCKFRFEGPDCPTYYTLNFEQFKLKDSANCTEDKLEVNGDAICGAVHGVKRYFAGDGSLTLQLKARSAPPVVKVFVNRSSCDVGLGTRTKEVEETTKMDVSIDIQKLQLVNEHTEILDDENNDREVKPAIFKSIYFFAAPEASDPGFIPKFHHTQKEILNPIYDKCIYRNQNGNYLYHRQNCRNDHSKGAIDVEQECIDLNYLRGYFRSPGYPFYYPANLNICYRFRVQPGYCAVRIFMNDFQLEDSFRCSKDYFLIPGDYSKYCGVDLFGRTVILDLSSTPSLDVQFQSDSYWCGRGFSGVYEQIACQQPYNPINPASEITTTEKPASCNAVIRDRRFSILLDGSLNSCHFRLFKSSSEVCKIRLFFQYFNTDCQRESFTISGRNYCGNLTGEVVTVPVNIYNQNDVKDIIYKSMRSTPYSSRQDWIIQIRGEQLSDDCSTVEPEVPVQRLLELPGNTKMPKDIRASTFEGHNETLNSSNQNTSIACENIDCSKERHSNGSWVYVYRNHHRKYKELTKT